MKNRIVKAAIMASLTISLAGGLSGCVGSNVVTGKLLKFNLEAVDNRYARGGLNFLLSPVYAFTAAADAFVFNSIEFWAGKNPINDNPHIFDTKTKTMLNINDDLDPSLHEAPVDLSSTDEKSVYSTQMVSVNSNTIDTNIVYTNGDTAVLRSQKNGDLITYYMDGEQVGTTTIDELKSYQASVN
ncbi:MAG: DUF3332 family protein [Psychromonas sp.]|nr:DUF3332 family protein [Psychromonas sp.]